MYLDVSVFERGGAREQANAAHTGPRDLALPEHTRRHVEQRESTADARAHLQGAQVERPHLHHSTVLAKKYHQTVHVIRILCN